ncbi:MAG TPA: MBL fold metallo-hydrolase [Gammaproteobacteria bacterium]|nr:MBL fold metallo-hydrolase [Gammaproteobacteria bacterium]
MEFAVLGSGSGGNCSLVRHGRTCLMVDNGFSVAETEKRLARLRTEPESVSAILVTHEHGDHISGVARFAARYDIPVWMTPGCYAFAQHKGLPNAGLLMLSEPLVIGDLEVLPVAVPHDSREPAQYVFSDGARRFGLLTDLGRITPHVIECYSGLDALMLEANHDSEMLANGPYPHRLKRRVAGNYGHLSNGQAADLLAAADVSRLQHIVAAHLSEHNNRPELARRALAAALGCEEDWIGIAHQDDGLDWRQVA